MHRQQRRGDQATPDLAELPAVRLLPGECQRTGMRKPLIVTDAGVRAAGAEATIKRVPELVPEEVARISAAVPAGAAAGTRYPAGGMQGVYL